MRVITEICEASGGGFAWKIVTPDKRWRITDPFSLDFGGTSNIWKTGITSTKWGARSEVKRGVKRLTARLRETGDLPKNCETKEFTIDA